ncbi:MAG: ABC transporter ATP-binding protein [Lautropia sp.]|nr:ABC transporter ATP-binding protein [Lautropia sp.]
MKPTHTATPLPAASPGEATSTAADSVVQVSPSVPVPEPSSSLLTVQSLDVTFDSHRGPRQVLSDVSFSMGVGEVLGVVGESGAGKSMTGLAIMGLIEPPGRISGGSIHWADQRIDLLRGEAIRQIRGRQIAMVFQDPLTSLNPVYTIGRHLIETIRTHLPLSEREARARALALLDEVEIPMAKWRMAQYPHQLSGGMRQRVAIALALSAEPRLLIADEPTTALDVSVQAQIIALLRRLCEQRQLSALLITHDMGVIAEAANRVMVMHHGRVVETGSVRQVLDHPQEPYTQALMAAIPAMDHRQWRLPVPEVRAGAGESGLSQPQTMAERVAAKPSAQIVPCLSSRTDKPSVSDDMSGEVPSPLLVVEGLSKQFDLSSSWMIRLLAREQRRVLQAVDQVSFQLSRGRTFGLVGESGSGKSTIARMVAGLIKPDTGRILIDGVSRWAGSRPDKALLRQCQMIFQDPYASLNPRWRVDQLIAEPLQVLGLVRDRQEVESRVADMLRHVRMSPDDGRKYPHEFSGGQRQRIAIARALISRPAFIICDEPTSALDVSVQAQVLNLMRDLQDEFGLTYLLISHNLAVIRFMCDDVGVMQRGRMVEQGAADAVLHAPQHEYTRQLMAAVPSLARPKALAF